MTAIDILSKLVSFSVLGGESNLSIVKWIQEYLESHEVDVHLFYNIEKTKASIICRIGPAVDDGVILSGHMDVVPVEGQEWATNPFELVNKGDGNLYARGACDMKGYLAMCLAVVPEMMQSTLKKPIYFAFSFDEEIGCLEGENMVKQLKETYSETPRFAIIGEPSMMQPVIGHKGIYVLKTVVNGSSGHSSRIRQEVSAIHEAARLILWLENKMNTLVDNGHLDDRFTPPHTSIHIGQINAGIAPNIIADTATFYWDIRVIPKDNAKEIVQEFKQYCIELEIEKRKMFPNFKIETTEEHPTVPVLDTNANAEVVDLVKRISKSNAIQTVAYASEAGHFQEGGYESIICGPGSIAQAHRANEFVSLEQLNSGVQMIQNLVKELN
ncbi:MAG: acetylornithine deacetylase (ArgE) [Bacteroidetes bacterium MedPE-SWsnd-G1]|nr:MAG: acetylornithine deacetylase (ArgE) [Bacteroidetes bacterium MedPE-SWsnd-G1]